MYTQCLLQLEPFDKNITTVHWIPDKFAKVNKILDIKKSDKEKFKVKVLEVYSKTDVDMAKRENLWDTIFESTKKTKR